MQTDRYTKVILTVIAALLALRCGQEVSTAGAGEVMEVKIVEVDRFMNGRLPVEIKEVGSNVTRPLPVQIR